MTTLHTKNAAKGFSLIEMSVALALGVMVSLGVASSVLTAVNAAISDKALKQQAYIHSYLISRLQTDMSLATAVTIPAGGTQVNIQYLTTAGLQTATWAYDNGNSTFTRNGTDVVNTLGDASRNQMALSCANPCFSGVDEDGAASTGTGGDNPIMLFEMDDFSAQNGSNDSLQTAFGAPAGATVDSYRFYLPAAKTFE